MKREAKRWWVWLKKLHGKWFKVSSSIRRKVCVLYGEDLLKYPKFEAYEVLPEGQRPKVRRKP
jgi:hypothetical protein